ncbi:MAG: hypothetical protein K0M67_01540 [Thiobacillus sp.]|jgi:hypothetical protein|uniref:Uncharacterized protein n=1 Tax=Hydrogenophaga aromaticivorans TaxID=2610898 RepID=A0A7Y8GWA6_9BURK|nr:hypothetical protein [Hydrogenophaga aromaticivorans]MBW8466919.1 hypothetical protein [Thiobacillus sp.]NWF46039.1 hypothetical protein [Hydrogenophaga aromaticivorans]
MPAPVPLDESAIDAVEAYLRAHEPSYSAFRRIDGVLCALNRFNFTTGLVVGLNTDHYERRYCYEHQHEALEALQAWDGRGHPGGPWIKCKGAGIDLLNPALCE